MLGRRIGWSDSPTSRNRYKKVVKTPTMAAVTSKYVRNKNWAFYNVLICIELLIVRSNEENHHDKVSDSQIGESCIQVTVIDVCDGYTSRISKGMAAPAWSAGVTTQRVQFRRVPFYAACYNVGCVLISILSSLSASAHWLLSLQVHCPYLYSLRLPFGMAPLSGWCRAETRLTRGSTLSSNHKVLPAPSWP